MSNEDLQCALAGVKPGSEVRLELADGRVVEGTFRGVEGDSVDVADADGVGLDEVVDFGVVVETDGLE